MADFGNAGTRTVHQNDPACIVDATAGEGIACVLDVRGALPLFTFVCAHRTALASPSGAPASKYEWSTYDQENSREDDDTHVLTLRFSGGAVWYRFRMDIVDANRVTVRTLKDVEYESLDPTDVAEEPIRVRTK